MTRTYEGLITDPIDTSEARFIASECHGGQWSALYAFSSSGYLDPAPALLEAEQTIDECCSGDDYIKLMELIDYLERQLELTDDE
jgi:hypothetical protein